MKHGKKPKVKIWTDGACSGNPGAGGWGALLRFNEREKQISGGENNTTNNRMELLAAINALGELKQPCEVDLYTDSKYLQNGVTIWLKNWQKRGWITANKKPVKNIDLWQQIEKQASRHNIKWHWVKGHDGVPENEIADRLATQAIDKLIAE